MAVANGDRLTPQPPDSFKPSRYAIHVNILWFSSLVIALSCGLGATLVQQWARRYLRLSQHSDTPAHRVRVRTFLYAGMKEFQVRLVVENISLLLHASIFLFFAGLVVFLLNINHEVAHVIIAIISVFATIYIILTALPVKFQQCPFQTPLTSVFWYLAHVIVIIFMFPFTCSSHIRAKIEEISSYTKDGFDQHVMKATEGKKILDKEAVRLTLGMCRDDGDVEAFLDAVPGYLHIDENVGTRIDDIRSLLNPKGTDDMPLGHRMVHLLSTCIHGDGKMDEEARRHRAITCSHVVLELSKAVSSLSVKGLPLDLPHAIGFKLQHLSRDHDPTIAFAALKTIAVLERALLEQLADPEGRMDPNKSAELARVLAAATSRYDRKDGRLIAVTEFTSNILELLKGSWHPSRHDTEDLQTLFEDLCRGLKGIDFLPATQESFANVVGDIWEAHSTFPSKGTLSFHLLKDFGYWLTLWQPLCSDKDLASLHLTIIMSLKTVTGTLDATYIELLKKRGLPDSYLGA